MLGYISVIFLPGNAFIVFALSLTSLLLDGVDGSHGQTRYILYLSVHDYPLPETRRWQEGQKPCWYCWTSQ